MNRDLQSILSDENFPHETQSKDNSSWRIEFVEKPLDLGFIDNLIFRGRDAGHSFLRLVDQYDQVRGELHGYSYDMDKEKISDAGFNPWKRVKHTFARSALPFNPNTLKVFHFGFERSRHEDLKPQTVLAGSRTEMIANWMKAINRGMDINAEDHEYRPLSLLQFKAAQNCHSVSSNLLAAMDVDAENIETVFAAPGFKQTIETSPEIAGGIMDGYPPKHLRNLYHAMAVWSEKLMPHVSGALSTSADDVRTALSGAYLRHEDNSFTASI